MNDERRDEFAFLPWLTLPQPVRIGGIRFVPVNRYDQSLDLGEWSANLRSILDTFRTFSGEQRSNWVVAEVDGNFYWDSRRTDVTDIQERVWSACEVLAIACIDRNEPYRQFGQRVHSSLFRPRYQHVGKGGWGIMFNQVSKFGNHGHGWGFDTIQCEPLNCHALAVQSLNHELLAALEPVLAPEGLQSTDDLRIKRAVHLFLLGYAEDSVRRQEDDCAQVVGALEVLLSRKRSTDIADELCKLLGFSHADAPLSRTSRASKLKTREPEDKRDVTKHIVWNWYVDAYQHRNKYRHRGWRSPVNPLWTVSDHDQFATLMFPLLLKHVLAKLSRYKLTEDDKCVAYAFPLALEDGDPGKLEDESSQESRWDKCVSRAWWDKMSQRTSSQRDDD